MQVLKSQVEEVHFTGVAYQRVLAYLSATSIDIYTMSSLSCACEHRGSKHQQIQTGG